MCWVGDSTLQGLDGEMDPNSAHGACDVLSGNKWSAVKWMREQPLI